MTASAAFSLRVLVKGTSTAIWISMMGGPRSDMTFSRVMEHELRNAGYPSEVRNTGEFAWLIPKLFESWNEDIAQWSPDVVVLSGGHETVHLLTPRWLERSANTVNRRPGFLRTLYYRKVMRLTARFVLLLQKRIDRPRFTTQRRMHRVHRDLESYIAMTRQVGDPLFLLLSVQPPTAAKREWFGGWTARIGAYNDVLRRLADANPNVQYVDIASLMHRFDPGTPEQLWADGIHFSPEFHQELGRELARITKEWAQTQPHLTQPRPTQP